METKQTIGLDKVTLREKAAFGLVNLGNIPIMTITGSFLLIFYTNVVGLDPAACATLFLIARIFDAVTDPLLGYFIDHLPNSRWGHFRPALAIGATITSVNFLLVFMGPYWVPGFKLGVAYITYLLIGILFDVMDISLNSMLPVMTSDTKERSVLSTVKGMFYMIGVFGLNIAAPMIIADTTKPEGYITLVVSMTVLVIAFSVLGAAGIKERIKPTPGPKYKIRDLWHIIKQRPVAITFLCSLIMYTGSVISQTATAFFYTYVLGDFTLLGLISIASMVSYFPGMLLSGVLAPRLGKKTLFIAGVVVGAVAPLIRLLSITDTTLLVVSTVVVGLGAGLTMPLNYGIQADNTDYVELAIGHRTEAAVASLSSFITKFALGIGGSIPGYLLAMSGFDATLQVQADSAVSAIIFCVCVAPPILSAIGAGLMMAFYPLNKKKLGEQEAEMKKRHALRVQAE